MSPTDLKHARAGFGLSITSNVFSAFDQKILSPIAPGMTVYDIGTGDGALARACADKGARVEAFDLSPSPKLTDVTWHQMDIRSFDGQDPRWHTADILIFRRILYYFSYAEALAILRQFKRKLKPGGMAFCSLIGLHSAYAQTGYPKDAPVQNRFATADNDAAKQYNMLHPVCMYTEGEAKALFEEAGFHVTDAGQSNWSVYITAII